MVSNCNIDFMRGLEHHDMNFKPHHTCHMPCHHFLCYSFVINELIFLYLVNFHSFSKSFNKFPCFYRMVSNCKIEFMRALEHNHMMLKPHHTCHIIIHVMSFPFSLMKSFDINDNHNQHSPPLELMEISNHSPPLTTMINDNMLCHF